MAPQTVEFPQVMRHHRRDALGTPRAVVRNRHGPAPGLITVNAFISLVALWAFVLPVTISHINQRDFFYISTSGRVQEPP